MNDLEEYKCVWCDGFMPFTPYKVKLLEKLCTCIFCDKCRERILIKDRIEGTRKCRRCMYGFVY